MLLRHRSKGLLYMKPLLLRENLRKSCLISTTPSFSLRDGFLFVKRIDEIEDLFFLIYRFHTSLSFPRQCLILAWCGPPRNGHGVSSQSGTLVRCFSHVWFSASCLWCPHHLSCQCCLWYVNCYDLNWSPVLPLAENEQILSVTGWTYCISNMSH